MSNIRDKRNRVFDAITPEVAKKYYEKHGRVVANAISLSRIVVAPALFLSAAKGKRNATQVGVRIAKTISDGYDGYTAEKDANFLHARPHITRVKQVVSEYKDIRKQRPDLPIRKIFPILLRAINGGIFDRLTDKVAQVADQAGTVVNRDTSASELLFTVGRNWLYDKSRHVYADHGVHGAEKAGVYGQAKTTLLDIRLAAIAGSATDKQPILRAAFAIGTVGLTGYSAYHGIHTMERRYLQQLGHDTSEVPNRELFATGVARTLLDRPYIEVMPTRLVND